jgi:imidazolonepropionase-like amidohydrolase
MPEAAPPSPSHFVDLRGFSPSEALQCRTRIGGQVMGLGNELGQIKEGYLADLLLVDGDSQTHPESVQ